MIPVTMYTAWGQVTIALFDSQSNFRLNLQNFTRDVRYCVSGEFSELKRDCLELGESVSKLKFAIHCKRHFMWRDRGTSRDGLCCNCYEMDVLAEWNPKLNSIAIHWSDRRTERLAAEWRRWKVACWLLVQILFSSHLMYVGGDIVLTWAIKVAENDWHSNGSPRTYRVVFNRNLVGQINGGASWYTNGRDWNYPLRLSGGKGCPNVCLCHVCVWTKELDI